MPYLHPHYRALSLPTAIATTFTFLALAVALIRQSFSLAVYKKRGGVSATIVIAATAGILGYLVQGLTDNVWYNYKMLLIFWIVVGLVSSGSNLIRETKEK